MGERTRSRIGTTEGVKTVRVYSANPKTTDGYITKFKADSEATSLHGQTQIGESAFEQMYNSRFRLALQGVVEAEAGRENCQGPKISVIVPVYRVEPYLHRCVDSILVQTYQDFELILVDDGSPDCCGEIGDEYAKKDRRVVVIHQTNGGLNAARNAGLDWMFAHSASEWVTFVDSDDWLAADYLKALYKGAQDMHCSLAAVIANTVCEGDVPGAPVVTDFCLKSPEEYWCDMSLLPMVAWGKLYAKSCFENVRYPVGKVHEDELLTYRVLFEKGAIAFSDSRLYYYLKRDTSIMGRGGGLRHVQGGVIGAD